MIEVSFEGLLPTDVLRDYLTERATERGVSVDRAALSISGMEQRARLRSGPREVTGTSRQDLFAAIDQALTLLAPG